MAQPTAPDKPMTDLAPPAGAVRVSLPPVEPPDTGPLADLANRDLTPQEHAEAVRRAAAQAEQRVRLGMQLYRAADASLRSHEAVLEQIRAESETARDAVRRDASQSLERHDRWLTEIDERLAAAVTRLDERIDRLAEQVDNDRRRIAAAMRRAETMMSQRQAPERGA